MASLTPFSDGGSVDTDEELVRFEEEVARVVRDVVGSGPDSDALASGAFASEAIA